MNQPLTNIPCSTDTAPKRPECPKIGALSIALLVVLGFIAPAMAGRIETQDFRHEESDGYRGDFRFTNNRGNFDASIRMGVATFEGNTYYAYVRKDGLSIRIAPEDGEGGPPTLDESKVCDIPVPNADNVLPSFFTGNAIVIGLVPRDGLLYLVCQGGKPSRVYIKALKTQNSQARVVPAAPLITIESPLNGDSRCAAAGVVSGDEGLYIHTLWTRGDDAKMTSYLLHPEAKKDDKKVELVLSKDNISASNAPYMVNTSDAAGTHEINGQGDLEEVHYFTWGSGKDDIWLARFLPSKGDRPAKYDFVRDTGYNKMDSRRNASTLTLTEGGMRGDDAGMYSLSLIEFATSVKPGGSGDSDTVTVLRHLTLASSEHRYTGNWSHTDFSFEQTTSTRVLAFPGTAHWGINKTRLVPANGSDGKPIIDNGPYRSTFMSSMQQYFRFSIMTFYTKYGFGSRDDYTSFHTAQVRGNQFITDPRDPSKNAITSLDTREALSKRKSRPLFSAWNLIGVIHGIPPYVPLAPYPSLTFTNSKTQSVDFSIEDTSEDSKEVTVAVSLGGGEIDRGGGAKGLFSIEGSYSYSFTAVDGHTTTNSKTNSVEVTEEFAPDDESSSYDPDRIGVLFYSAPVFVSKGYAVRRWNGDKFNDSARNIYQTVVAHREQQILYYLLDAPDLGPLMENPDKKGDLKPNIDFAPLTAGIPPVPQTSKFNKWVTPNLKRDIQSYREFTADHETATITSDRFTGGTFALNYTVTVSKTDTHAETKKHTGTVEVSGGLDGIFNIDVSGSVTKSNTFSTTSTTATSVGQGLGGTFPKLSKAQGDFASRITVTAYLLSAKDDDDSAPEWTPTALKGTPSNGGSSPFLLTWTASVSGAKKKSAPWRDDR